MYNSPLTTLTLDDGDRAMLRGVLYARRREIDRKLAHFAKHPAGRNWLARERQVGLLRHERFDICAMLERVGEPVVSVVHDHAAERHPES